MHRDGWRVIGILGMLLALAVPLGAQDHPAVERGFAAETLYQFADLDSVNLLNGAVSVRIPIGGAYPAGGSLSYQLNLVYSSKLWDFEEVVHESGYLVRSLPARHTTAGFGWTLSLGRLLPPNDPANETDLWQYLDPVGGRHGLMLPQLWNRYAYALGNPLKYVDPTGEAVSIRIHFKGHGWTEDMKAEIIANVRKFWEGLGVGDVFVFDGRMLRHGNLFGSGQATITVDSDSFGSSHAKKVEAGDFLGSSKLSMSEKLDAIANAVNHEVFTHQFGINSALGDMDSFNFSRHIVRDVGPKYKDRYGTVLDSWAWSDPHTRGKFVSGPVPVHPEDAAEAQERLGPLVLSPPRLLFPLFF